MGRKRKGIDIKSDNLGLTFQWLTRNKMGPHFGDGSIAIGPYQCLQCHAIDVIVERAETAGYTGGVINVCVRNGMVCALPPGPPIELISCDAVRQEASKRSP